MDDSRPYRPHKRVHARPISPSSSVSPDDVDTIDAIDTVPLASSDWWLPEVQPPYSRVDEETIRLAPQGRPPRRGVSRRKLLVGAGAGAVGIGLLGTGAAEFLARQQTESATKPISLSSPDAAKIGHMLRRLGFGPSPDDLQEYLDLGVSGTLDRLLNYSKVSNEALEKRLSSFNFKFTLQQDIIRWGLLRMIFSQRPFEEKMTLFWHGVLTSSFTKTGGTEGLPFIIKQDQLLRAKGLGRFDDLVHAMTIDPSMLFWLDGRLSSGKSPNENYAREVMELFTMGIGNYTQDDVHQGALALTGWVVRAGGATFVPARHYNGPVTFLGHTGPMTVDDVVRLVCAHPATGAHLARRMWRFFVYDNPSPRDIQPLSDAYYKSNHNIMAMVRAMVSSPAFFSAQAYRARVKSPLEFVVGAIRAFGLTTNANGLVNVLSPMGQVPFAPPNVAGWPGDGASAEWMSTQAWITRINFANLAVNAAGRANARPRATINLLSPDGTKTIQRAITQRKLASEDDVVSYYVSVLLDGALDASRRAVLSETLSSSPIKGEPTYTLAGGKQISAAATAEMLYLLMSLPEYQMN